MKAAKMLDRRMNLSKAGMCGRSLAIKKSSNRYSIMEIFWWTNFVSLGVVSNVEAESTSWETTCSP